MTTDAQNEANPANVPLEVPLQARTEEGKAISSCLNSLKHGPTAAAVLRPGEELVDSVLTRTRTEAGCGSWRWAAALVCTFTLAAQTKIDLGRQSKNVDFSGAPFTKPSRMGASMPASCSQGETFFLTTAQPGSNFYLCTSTNTWSLPAAVLTNSGVVAGAYGSATQVPSFTVNSQGIITGASAVPISGGSGGGASQSSDLTDCKVTVQGATATVTGPCRLAIGSTVHILTGNATATLSGISSSGTAYFYWDSNGNVHVDQNSPATLTCSALCSTASNGNFPASSFPIASATFSANSFTGGTLTDLRSVYSYNPLVAGYGLSSTTDGNGDQRLSVDTTAIATVLAAQSGSLVACNDSGTVNAIVCTPSQPLTGYTTNMVLQVVPAHTNTSGTMTIDVSGLGNVTVKQSDGVTNPTIGQSIAGVQAPWTYDGTYFRLPPAAGSATVPHSCTIAIGDPGAASPVLASDNNAPSVCGNMTGANLTITAIGCWANAGAPTVNPILTGGSGTSILTGPLTCGTGSWAGGTVNGTPTLHSFTAASACSTAPCTIDANLASVDGTAKYVVIQVRF